MKQFSPDYLSDLTEQAKTNDRLRQHRNIHQSFQDPCQRLFNAIEPGSYIRPHRHASDPRDELLVAIRGLMALITFDDNGTVTNVLRLGTEKYGPATCPAAEVPSDVGSVSISVCGAFSEIGCWLDFIQWKAPARPPEAPPGWALRLQGSTLSFGTPLSGLREPVAVQ